MADGGSDDDVIHLRSFNLHRSQGSRRRQRELITISDDSDEEPITLVPSSPVYVPDDDDVSILGSSTPARRQVIRPAAKWSAASFKSNPPSSSSSAASTSRELKATSSTLSQTIPPLEVAAQTQSGSTAALSHPNPRSNSVLQVDSSTQTSTKAQANDTPIRPLDVRPSTSELSLPGTSSQVKDEPQASTSSASCQSTVLLSKIYKTCTPIQLKISTGGKIQDNPQASTSSAHMESQPSTSKQALSTLSASAAQVKTLKLLVLPQQPSIHASTLIAQPQIEIRTSMFRTQGNLIHIEPQVLAQAPALVTAQAPSQTSTPAQVPVQALAQAPTQTPAQAPTQAPAQAPTQAPAQAPIEAPAQAPIKAPTHSPSQTPILPQVLLPVLGPVPEASQAPAQAPKDTQIIKVKHPPVLVASAPERLGPLQAGHGIVLCSFAPHQQPGPANSLPNQRNKGPSGQTSTKAPVAEQALHPNRPAPSHGLGTVPSVAEDIPRIEDAQPGPSEPRDRPEHPNVRDMVARVLDLFPDVQEAYVADLIQKGNVKDLNVVCNLLLENPQYPQREIAAASSILLEPGDTQSEATEDLFDYSQLDAVEYGAMMQAADLLMADFRMLSCQDIKWALNALKGHYAITRKALWEALKKWQDSGDPSGKRRRSRTSSTERCYIDFHFEHGPVKFKKRMYFLEHDRRYCRTYSNLVAPVQKELSFYKQKAKEWAEHEDFLLALQVNEDEYKKDGQLIQCGCCYGDFAFEKMTQCSDGHLFCQECLVNYAREAVFGSGKSELSCMSENCPCSFPVYELNKVLPENVLCKYYERQAEEAVAATCADELVRCPFCNFPALLDKGIARFSCPNPRCRKESCRKCHVLWKEHAGKTCAQVLERDEIRMRVLFEERMTAARVRKCTKCGTGLVKSEGCNRMSCRCGGFMCYLCREPISGYNHFCQHARSPGAPCRHCRKCSLWTDPTQDDERIIQEIQKEGEAELSKKSTDNSGKRVGPPPEPVPEAKRLRVGLPQNHAPEPNQVAPNQPQAVQAPLFVPPRDGYPHAPLAPRLDNQGVLPGIPPAPYVLPLMPILNNNNQPQHQRHHHQNPQQHYHHHHNPHHNWDMPMHYGPHHRYYRR